MFLINCIVIFESQPFLCIIQIFQMRQDQPICGRSTQYMHSNPVQFVFCFTNHSIGDIYPLFFLVIVQYMNLLGHSDLSVLYI